MASCFSPRGSSCLLPDRVNPAPVLSQLRSQSKKVLAPGPTAARPAARLPALRPVHLQCFLQVTNQKAGWKMPVLLVLCLLQGESRTQPRFRVGKTRPAPSRLQRLLAGSSVWADPGLSLPGSKARHQIRPRGKEGGESSLERAYT